MLDYADIERLYYEGKMPQDMREGTERLSQDFFWSKKWIGLMWNCLYMDRLDEIGKPLDMDYNPEHETMNYDLNRGKYLDFTVVNGIRSVSLAGGD